MAGPDFDTLQEVKGPDFGSLKPFKEAPSPQFDIPAALENEDIPPISPSFESPMAITEKEGPIYQSQLTQTKAAEPSIYEEPTFFTKPLHKFEAPTRDTIDKVVSIPMEWARERIESSGDQTPIPPVLSKIAQGPSDKTLNKVQGVLTSAADTGSFFTSPMGVSMLAIGGLPSAVQRTVALAFAAQMGAQVPEIATALGDEYGKPEDQRDYKKIGKLVTDAITATGFSAALTASSGKAAFDASKSWIIDKPSALAGKLAPDLIRLSPSGPPVAGLTPKAPEPSPLVPPLGVAQAPTAAPQPTQRNREVGGPNMGDVLSGRETMTSPELPALAPKAEAPAAAPAVEAAEKPLVADMDSARRVANMSDDEFMRVGGSFNKTNVELGENATAEDVVELKKLHAAADKELNGILEKAHNHTATMDDINRLGVLQGKVQYFSEAIQAAPKEVGGNGRGFTNAEKLAQGKPSAPPAPSEAPRVGLQGDIPVQKLQSAFQKFVSMEEMTPEEEALVKRASTEQPELYNKLSELYPVNIPGVEPIPEGKVASLGLSSQQQARLDAVLEKLSQALSEKGAKTSAPTAPTAAPEPLPITPEPKPAAPEQGMPPSQSLGGALAGEDLGKGDFVSNMFAAIDRDRTTMGKQPMDPTVRRSWSEDESRALSQMNRDPNWIPDLLDRMEKQPRPLLSWENAGVVFERGRLKAEYNNALQRVARAFDDNRTEDLAAAKTDAAAFEDRLERLDRIVGRNGTGSEAGRSLQAQKMGAGDDFTLIEMTLQKRAALGGRRLTPDETSAIQKDVDRLNSLNAALQKNLSEAEGKTREANAKIALEAIEKENLRKQIPAFDKRVLAAAQNVVNSLKNQANSARERIAARQKQPGATSGGIDPADIDDYAIIASSHIAEFGLTAAKVIDRMAIEFGESIRSAADQIITKANALLDNLKAPDPVKRAVRKGATDAEKQTDITERIKAKLKDKRLDEITPLVQKLARQFSDQGVRGWRGIGDAVHGVLKELIPDLDYRDTLDAVSGHGKFKIPNQEEGAKALRDAKGQMQEVRKIQEVIARQPVQPTGLKRDLPSDIKRRLTQIYENAKRKFGIVITDPATQLRSALQARKTYYEHRISDLQAEINSRKRVVKTKAPSPSDPALEKLVAEYKLVKAAHDEVFGPRELTDAQRAERESKSLDRQIAEVQRQLKEGDIFPGGKTARPTSPEIEARRANLEALKSERDYLRESINPKTTPEQQELAAVESRRKQLQKRLDEAERKINTGDITAGKVTAKPELTPELQAMRDELGQMNEMVAKLRAAIRPELTDAQRLSALKASLLRNNAKLSDKIARGDFSKRPRREVVMDQEATRLRAESERIKKRWREALVNDRLKNRNNWEKTLDWGTKYRRAGVLSSPVVIPKLISAGIQRLTSLPLEEAAGSALGKIPGVSGVAARAPLEGGGSNLKAELRGFSAAFTQGMRDAYAVLKTGHSDLDVLYGKAGESYTGEFEMASKLLALPGRIHGMIKAPIKRATFERAVQRYADFYARQGLDLSDEVLKTRIAVDAYKAANRSIFLQDNMLASKVSAFLAEKRSNETGHATVGSKVLATTGRVLLPIVRVPTNIVHETMQYAGGLASGSARLGVAMAKGIDKLSPDEADLIMRELKKGSIGAAVLALGYFNADAIGGYYQPNRKQKPGAVKYGSIRVNGMDIPAFLLHNPLLECLQAGATVRRVADSKLRKKDAGPQGLPAGVGAAAFGMVEQVPFMREMSELEKLRNPYTRGEFLGEQAKSIAVPSIVQKTAEWMDQSRKRKPTTVLQHIETGIPGLRKSVPLDTKAK
jgi:hypothetical protein